MKRLTYILFLVCLLGCVACKSKSMDPTMDQFTISATNTDSQVDFVGYIDYHGNSVEGKTIVPSGNLGVMISTHSDMSEAQEYRCYSDNYWKDSTNISFSNQKFYRTVYNLPNGTYYYRAYADAPYSTRITTDVQSIAVVNKEVPTFCDVAIFTDVAAKSLKISYRIKELGDYPITSYGLRYNMWGKQSSSTKVTVANESPSEDVVYTTEVTGLSTNTKYYFWMYAVTSKGTFYSNEWVVTTLSK